VTRSCTFRFATLLLLLTFAGLSWGANALIVTGATSVIDTDNTNLSNKLTTATFTVTTNVGVPAGSLATYQQIWDTRFNQIVLSPSDVAAYTTYLAGGGNLFLMGENTGFNTRNFSIVSLIAGLGGGTIAITTPTNNVTVLAPFATGITNPFTFQAAAGTSSAGPYGAIATDAAGIAPAIVYGPGSLTSAPAGSVIIVFDVNFLGTNADANSQQLIVNLIGYLAAPVSVPPLHPPVSSAVPSTIPALSTWAFLILAAGLIYIACRRLGRKQPEHLG
jgi:hypothetical protein